MAQPVRIGLIGCGEMGAAIGAHLASAGHRVSTVIAGRGPETQARVAEASIAPLPDARALVAASDLLLSVTPPSVALRVAAEIAPLLSAGGPAYVDANAISPALLRAIEAVIAPTGAVFIDAGIVGSPPAGGKRPKFYWSGPVCAALSRTDGIAFDLVPLGSEPGRASAFKMAYAALTKGTNALLTAALLLAQRHDMLDIYLAELGASQPELLKRAEANVSRLPADSGRWAFEMEEIARTFADAGLPSGFHEGAADIMRILDASRFGTETRRTMDRTRSMPETIEAVDKDRG